MRDRGRDFHEPTPHFDGELESVINDTLATQGNEIGVRSDVDPSAMNETKNPFNAIPDVDSQMKKFRSLMRGKEIK